MLVGPHDGRVEHDPVQVGRLQGLKGRFPYAFLGQAAEAPIHGIRLAEAFRQVGPRAGGAHYPDDGGEKQSVVLHRYAAVRGFAGQDWRDGFPLSVGNFVTTHIPE